MKKLVFFILFLPVLVHGQIITTVAGNGYGAGTGITGGYSGDNGPATAAELFNPTGVAIDASGTVYIADEKNHCIRKINSSGIITTIAGNDTVGCSGDGIEATAAFLYAPLSVTVDDKGNIFIADYSCGRIRKINSSGFITTIAGNGNAGFSGDGGPATNAALDPQDVAFDTLGNIYIADILNNVVRKVNTSGIINTIAGNTNFGFSGDGGLATAAELRYPSGIAVDKIGNVYIGDRSNNRIRKVSFDGIITTIAGQDTAGYNGDNRPATTAELNGPNGVKVDEYGDVYFADSYNDRIRKIDTFGIITTIAGPGTIGNIGDGGSPTLALLLGPNNMALDASGNIYIADAGDNRIRLITYDLSVPYLTIATNDVNIWPNPTESTIAISATEIIKGIRISNLLGQVVYSHEYGNKQVQVNVSDFPVGIYFIKVNGAVMKKFIKE